MEFSFDRPNDVFFLAERHKFFVKFRKKIKKTFYYSSEK